MRKLLLLVLTLFLVTAAIAKPRNPKPDPKKENKILEIVMAVLKNKHFVSKKMDDNFSRKMFASYIDSLDRYKMFLLESDIAEFKKYETKLDDQLKSNDLTFFFISYDRIMLRMREGKELYTSILNGEIDYTTDQKNNFINALNTDSSKDLKFKKNKSELLKEWKNLIKTFFILRITSEFITSGKTNSKDFEDYFNAKKTNLGNLLESTAYNFENVPREKIFEFYVNSIVVQFDPHSRYFNPSTRDQYLNRQSGKVEGAGITIRLADNFIQIKKMIINGPAFKSKKLEIDDVILKIGQENEEPISVIGNTIFDAVKLLKGKSGTILKLTVKKPDGKIVDVTLKRAVISTNDSYLKSSLVVKNNVKYAVVSFPRFYSDFDDDMIRNVADDFEDELEILKKSDVQGIVLDLRDNGGGSVEAAIKILGNFTGKSPIVQVKNKDQLITTFESEKTAKTWDKSIVLLVNSATASAAEIIAASFQEYNLGITIGEPTFGKGTIQEFLDLNSFNSKKNEIVDFGALKITTQKFYKLNGKSVQKNGIKPNIIIASNDIKIREAQIPNILITDEVKPLVILPIHDYNFYTETINSNQTRINKYFNSGKLNEFKDSKFSFQTLNLKKIIPELDNFLLKINDLIKQKYQNNLEFTSTAADVKLFKKKEYLLQKRKDWLESLPTDYILEEGINVLEGMNMLK